MSWDKLRFETLCKTIKNNTDLFDTPLHEREMMLNHLGSQGISTWSIFLANHLNFVASKARWHCRSCNPNTSGPRPIPYDGQPLTDVTEIFEHLRSQQHQQNLLLRRLSGNEKRYEG